MRSRYLIVEKKTKGKTFTVTLMGTGTDLLRVVGEQVNGIEKQVRGLRIMNAQSPFAARPARAKAEKPALEKASQLDLRTAQSVGV